MRVIRVPADASEHRDFMTYFNEGGTFVDFKEGDFVYIVEEKGSRLIFVNLEQVREARDWFMSKTHPSTRNWPPPIEHCWNPWFCRLPKQFTTKPARPKVLKALQKILSLYG